MISIRKIRIVNFKSIKSINLTVDKEKTVFVGQNNAGKSNINKAIDVVFNHRYIPSELDFYNGAGEDEKCYIDIMISANTVDKNFDTDWLMIFGDKVVKNDFEEDSFTIRTVISKNETSKRLEIDRFPILDWHSDEFNPGNKVLPKEIRKCIGSYYLNSDRDISEELRVRNSNFSKLMKNVNFELSQKDTEVVEKGLEIINRMILRKMPSIAEIEDNLSDISTTLDNVDNLRILPIPNRFDDLDKGVEIQISDDENELPISVYGDGTRSWISILTLSAYIKSLSNQLSLEGLPYFAIVLLEEPESHLHPQAQNKVITQLDKIDAQLFVTTHSSNIVSELGVSQLFRVCNEEGTQLKTEKKSIIEEDELKIMNFILPFYTEILFSEQVVLVEGVTDKMIITEYLKSRVERKPFEIGVSIVAVNGKDNFPIFRQFCEIHSIKDIIYADNDANPELLKTLQDKSLSIHNVFFTEEMDMELELVNNQLEICKRVFTEENNYPKQYIANLISEGTLNEKIFKFFSENKTQYPHWISKYIDINFSVKSLNDLIQEVGRMGI